MSIEKLDSAQIRQEKLPFTMHLNFVLQKVTDPVALGIWCYLTSLPEGWTINRCQLMQHFDIGRDVTSRTLKYLNDNKLIEYIRDRHTDGTITKWIIHVKNGTDFKQHYESNNETEKLSTSNPSTLLKNQRLVKPVSGKTAPIKKEALKALKALKEKEKNKRESKTEKPLSLPDNFKLEDYQIGMCRQKGFDPDLVLHKFRSWAKSSGKKSKNWTEEANLWILREKESPRNDFSRVSNETHSTIKFWEPGNPDYDRVHGLR